MLKADKPWRHYHPQKTLAMSKESMLLGNLNVCWKIVLDKLKP